MRHIEADIAALSAAQAACLAAARPFAKNGATSSSNSVSTAAAGDSKYAGLRHELDRAYLAACKVTEWREMIQVGPATVCEYCFCYCMALAPPSSVLAVASECIFSYGRT
jgi:hypothetical protein